MESGEAFDLISHAIDAGRAAHGYLIVGDLHGNAEELVRKILGKLFPNAVEQAMNFLHPDVTVLEPEGRLRIIKVETMREKLIDPMTATAFSGGWKVGIIYGADRLNAASANAFLKSLEEPTPKTMYFLLTDQPNALIATIVSRVQRIDLPLSEGLLEGEAYERVAEAFAARSGARLAALLVEMKDEAENAEVPLVRKQFFKTVMSFVRAMMLGGKLPNYLAFHNVEAVEEAYRQCEKSMNEADVLGFMMDRLRFPSARPTA